LEFSFLAGGLEDDAPVFPGDFLSGFDAIV
jgi:hypothetical protein